jgi:hypothetical protein
MLYRWFVGLSIDDPVWDHLTFSVNRDRLILHNVSTELLAEMVASAQKQKLLSNDHFSVDGTLIQAWASQKIFRPNQPSMVEPVIKRVISPARLCVNASKSLSAGERPLATYGR